MKRIHFFTVAFFALIASLTGCVENNYWEISSPDGSIKSSVSLDANGALSYEVVNNGKQVIETSPLGIVTSAHALDTALTFINKETRKISESYKLWSGKTRDLSFSANELALNFEGADGGEMTVVFQASNEGVAFKYNLSGKSAEEVLLADKTGFKLPTEGKAWMHPYDTIAPWAPAYETFYREVKIGEKAPENKNGWAFPMLFNVAQNWVLISEALLEKEDAAFHVNENPANGLYTLLLPEEEEARGVCSQTPVISEDYDTPWRVLMISEKIGDIVESNLVTHLSAPLAINDTEWINPGKSSWSWWSISESTTNYDQLKDFVDFSARMGWDYSLVDANWNMMKGGDLKKLAEYAATKNVGLLVWYNSGGAHNTITEQPRNLMDDREKRRNEFKMLHEMGVKGVKVDFFQSDKPCIIQQYIEILEDAAEFEILVNFHGCALPHGWRRTYPNLMTMESIRGGEAYRFDKKYPEVGPVHMNIATFSRNVVGPMDYTPVTLTKHNYPRLTTDAHELAQAVVFESGIQHMADHYKAYEKLPDFALNYLKNVPVVWDEIKFVDGYPAEYTVLARRKGNKWYIAGINGTTKNIKTKIKFDFIESSLNLNSIEDGSENKLINNTYSVNAGEVKTLELSPRGGFILYSE